MSDSDPLCHRINGCDEGVRRDHGEPEVAAKGGWSVAAHQDEHLPGHAVHPRTGGDGREVQLCVGLAAVAIRQ